MSDYLTVVNLAGFGICSFGVLLYHFVKQRKEVILFLRTALGCLGLGSHQAAKSFVQMLDEDENHSAAGTAVAGAAGGAELQARHVAANGMVGDADGALPPVVSTTAGTVHAQVT